MQPNQTSRGTEIFDSDDDDNDLPFVKQILASSKRLKQVIDLTGDDDDDREGDDGDFVKPVPPSLIGRIQVTDQFRSPFTALSAKITATHRQRPDTVVHSGHTR
jgi:hypothetical protein